MTVDVGLRIKGLRTSKKISAADLGKAIGKSRATIYRYENGDIEDMPYTVLIPIAKALGTTPTYLLGVDEEKAPFEYDIIEKITNWLNDVGTLDFTDSEIKELVSFAKFLLSKRGDN